MSYDVNLAKDRVPVFPDRCIVCGADPRGTTLGFATRSIGWWSVLHCFGRKHRASVPTCPECVGDLKTQRRVRELVIWIFILLGILAAVWLMAEYKGPFKRWIMIGIALTAAMPYAIWESFYPRVFDMTAYSSTVDYEFKNAEYAGDFARLNPGGKV